MQETIITKDKNSKSEIIQVRVSKEFKELVKERAKNEGVPITQYIRNAVLRDRDY